MYRGVGGKTARGSLTDIMLSGSIKVTAEAANLEAAYTSCMGGVVGQCNGTLANVDNLRGGSGAEIVVTNKCRGTGSRYTGGVVGLLTDANGTLEGGNVRVSVHAEEAEGSWNYTGGVAGGVRFGALVSDVTVAGDVRVEKWPTIKKRTPMPQWAAWWVMSTRHR